MKNAIMKFIARRLCQMPLPIVRLLGGKPIVVDGQTLDPVTQMMVKHFSSSKPDSLEEDRASTDLRGPWLSHPPAPGMNLHHHTLQGPNGPIPCEIHRSAALPERDAPVLIYYHGGGHISGSSVSHRGVCRQLAHDANCAVVSVDYRLAPEHKFPIGINDCLAAFDAVVEQAAELGFDPGRVAVGGDSAGGNAAAVVAQQRKGAPHPPKYQILWVPWVDMSKQSRSVDLFAKGFYLEKSTIEWMIDLYLAEEENKLDPMASPLLGDVRGTCPASVLVAGFDPLRDEGVAYAEKLKSAGVKTELMVFENLVHPFPVVSGYVPAANEAFKQAASLIRANI